MKHISEGVKIIISVIVCILLGIWIGLTYDDKEIMNTPTQVPPCPDNSKAMYYDFNGEKWIYVFREDRRANGKNRNIRPSINEDDLQEYLEKNVDGYFEDTYWGGEYDLD